MEEWKRKKAEETTMLETRLNPGEGEVEEETLTSRNDDQSKRKKENPERKSKKKKLEPLTEWGEGEVENSVWETWPEVEESTTQRRD